MAHAASVNLANGFPTPGPQDPTSSNIMDHVFFLNESQWKAARETENYDVVVVGTGPCALGFVHRALENNPSIKILVLERGTFFLPEHFQNLPSATQEAGLSTMAETYPWTVDARSFNGKDGRVKYVRGQMPFFGGRSTLWSCWCPRPTDQELDGWPEVLKAAARKEFHAAEALLNVQNADMVDSSYCEKTMEVINKSMKRPVYRALQNAVQDSLQSGSRDGSLPGIYRVDPAPIASRSDTGVDFQKFSTPGPFLELLQNHPNLHIATNVTVKRILREDTFATALDTSRGVLPLGQAKLVLAMGCLPPTTLISNSFPELRNIGKRFAAHFVSSIVARVPKAALEKQDDKFGNLELGAVYIAGVADGDFTKQYHIQLSALYDQDPEDNFYKAFRYMPDVVATASQEQLRTSKDYVVLVCAVLGELDYRTKENTFLKNPDDPDITTRSKFRVVSNGVNDATTWDAMDNATFATLELLSKNGCGTKLEYWRNGFGWIDSRPTADERRAEFVFHESSTLHAGYEEDAPVDPESYRLKGTDNVYITGGGLWPQGGSWNPTMTMTGLAMDLANKLTTVGTRRVLGYDVGEIVAELDPAENVYIVLKDKQSHYLWVNKNFADLVGKTQDELIGTKDTHMEHVKHDEEVLSSGKALRNFHETITAQCKTYNIVTQKGLIRNKNNPNEFLGISVCFSISSSTTDGDCCQSPQSKLARQY